jgi:YD repeat-containing protein
MKTQTLSCKAQDMVKKRRWIIGLLMALSFSVYGYAYANAVVIVIGDDFFVIPIGARAPSSAQSLSYEYDALGRLVEVSDAGTTQTYDLDAAGHRTVIRIF